MAALTSSSNCSQVPLPNLNEIKDLVERIPVTQKTCKANIRVWQVEVARAQRDPDSQILVEDSELATQKTFPSLGSCSGKTMPQPVSNQEEEERREALFRNKMRGDEEEKKEEKTRHDEAAVVVVQDRSKSKSARVREEARAKERSSNRKRKAKEKLPHSKSKRVLMDCVDQYRYDDRSRGRILISSTHAHGIFGKGASSGQFVASDKRLPNQTAKEMLQNTSAKPREIPIQPQYTSSEEESTATIKRNRKREELLKQKLKLEQKLKELQNNIDGTRAKKKPKRGMTASECSSDGHSAYSSKQRARRRKEELRLYHRQEKELQKDLAMATQEIVEKQKQVKYPSSPSSPQPAPHIPVQLAFDGDRPHQHPNAWRGQHTRDEVDWREMRENFDASGGPDLRSGRPLDFIINDLGKEEIRNDQSVAWEVLPGDYINQAAYGAGQSFNEQYKNQQGQYEIPLQHQPHYEEHIIQQIDEEVDYYGDTHNDDWLDKVDTFGEYIDYNDNTAETNLEPSPSNQNDMFDQEAHHREDRWLDEETYIDQFEQDKESSTYDLRAAIQPTKEDLPYFWKPQHH